MSDHPPTLVVHAGAGQITAGRISPKRAEERRRSLRQVLETGRSRLLDGCSSVEVVVDCVRFLEDVPYFNAGRGAVFSQDGEIELEASVMEGSARNVGAVALLQRVKNPVELARRVLWRTDMVFLCGSPAERFAEAQELAMVRSNYHKTSRRLQQWRESDDQTDEPSTVGAVALDRNGDLASATSTGGRLNKPRGRVGDSAIPGAGTYAHNATCAVSCTGLGEFFVRTCAAHTVAERLSSNNIGIGQAALQVVDEIGEMGGSGGLIGLTSDGSVAMPYNSKGMQRGMVRGAEEASVCILK